MKKLNLFDVILPHRTGKFVIKKFDIGAELNPSIDYNCLYEVKKQPAIYILEVFIHNEEGKCKSFNYVGQSLCVYKRIETHLNEIYSTSPHQNVHKVIKGIMEEVDKGTYFADYMLTVIYCQQNYLNDLERLMELHMLGFESVSLNVQSCGLAERDNQYVISEEEFSRILHGRQSKF